MRIGLGRGLVILALGIVAIGGCGRSEDSTPTASEPPPPTRPTTQDLVSGDRTELDIKSAPLSVKVPPSWKVELVDGITMLEGPTPSGDTTITVTTLPGMSSRRIELMVDGAEADAQQRPDRVQVHDLHQINGLRVIDKIMYTVSTTQASTQPDDTNAIDAGTADTPIVETGDGQLISWSRLVFVPFEDTFLPCSFSVSAMTPNEYGQDQAFLQSVLDSAKTRPLEDAP